MKPLDAWITIAILSIIAVADAAYGLLWVKGAGMLLLAGIVFGFCVTGASQVSNVLRLQHILKVHRRLESKYPSGAVDSDAIVERSFSQVFFPKKLWGKVKVALSTTLFTLLLLLIDGSPLRIIWLVCGALGMFAGSMVWLLLLRIPRSVCRRFQRQ